MHYYAWAVIEADAPTDEAVNTLMAPHRETMEGGFWDWYQIGGRWTGELTEGYDPRGDPQNVETCRLCGGTGRRDDGVGERLRKQNPDFSCNGCQGAGKSVKWPTEFARHPGDRVPLDLLDADKHEPPYTVVFPDGEAIHKHNWDGETMVETPNFLDLVWSRLASLHNHTVVVVDYHR